MLSELLANFQINAEVANPEVNVFEGGTGDDFIQDGGGNGVTDSAVDIDTVVNLGGDDALRVSRISILVIWMWSILYSIYSPWLRQLLKSQSRHLIRQITSMEMSLLAKP